jgi:two-component system, cell cycle response regulator
MSGSEDDARTVAKRISKEASRLGERDRACLIVLRGMNVGEMYKLARAEMVIGRGQSADIEILDDGASRRHALMKSTEDGGATIEDLGSRNGTYVNGERIAAATVLRDGDKIQLSSQTILKFTFQDRLDESFQRRMYESALRDGLTKAFNKKYFLDRLEREFRFARRHRQPLSLVMIDVDHFKKVNDQHGHLAGDAVLQSLAAHIGALIRSEDVFARYGGEEFAIICRATEVGGAVAFADRVRVSVQEGAFSFEGNPLPITISLGVAGITADQSDYVALVAAADQALLNAKTAGRNRVVGPA